MNRVIKNHNEKCNLEFISNPNPRYSKIDWQKIDEYFSKYNPEVLDQKTFDAIKKYVYGEKLLKLNREMKMSGKDYKTQKLLERDYMKIHQDCIILLRDYQKHQKTQKYFQLYIDISNFCEKVSNLIKTL